MKPDPRRMASRDRVLSVLRKSGPLARGELARRTGLSRATVSSIVSDLQHAGVVVEPPSGARPGLTGRPPSLVRLDRSVGAAVGIDFGKRHLRVAVADLGHRLLAERCVEMDPDHEASDGMQVAAALVAEVVEDADVRRADVIGVGMGLPGPVHQPSGELGSSTILPGWVAVHAQDDMTRLLGMGVEIDNDANLGALGEWLWGAAVGCEHVAYLKLSTGIGAGLIAAGRPFRGAGGTAGEIGHTIVDPSGPVCRCGNRGCLETFVGAAALMELLRPALGTLTLHEMLARAEAGEAGSRRVIADAGAAIGTATANLCNLFNPERIVVGGDLATAGELLLGPMRAALSRAAIPSAAADVEVVAGVLGERAEVLGAIGLALRGSGLEGANGATRQV